ncbi:hypothetical protein [Nocardiopsis sp. SBT366]|uniref:hypothetical protein n=1 Tax=Nocardiopsis sp. SBT366 TaxID=1580529 RepID=UPI000A684C11|nr:hypothetical protein [Nocardiopsis sp. SBT366]
MLALVVLVLVSGCSTEKTPDPEVEADPRLDSEWIGRHARVRVLDRMFLEEDPVDVFERLSEDDQESLITAGIVVRAEGVYEVETDPGHWDDSAIRQSGQVDGSLMLLMRRNDITWCGDSYRAGEPVIDYVNRVNDAFDSPEEYYESMDDFVDCGDGGV